MKIGVVALQGAFAEHLQMLRRLGIHPVEVRLPHHLEGLDGLIIPGGESTTIGKLAVEFKLVEPLRRFAAEHAVWGTCAGMIVMAKDIDGDSPLLSIMDISVRRNAFGRQVDSFEVGLNVGVLSGENASPFPGIFIRAPMLTAVRGMARVIATLENGTAVAALEGKWLATSFHPELTGDLRFHRFFLGLVEAHT